MGEHLTIMGAGGTMGSRIRSNLSGIERYDIRCVEPDQEARERIEEDGFTVYEASAAVPGSDIVILAVPDHKIGEIAASITPLLDPNAMVFLLDPAAAYAGVVPTGDDNPIFVTHPCHPPLFGDGPPDDWFGGQGQAEQALVCALHHGDDAAYERGVTLARAIFAPVAETYRISVEQMAQLEPGLVENMLTAFLLAMQDGADQLIESGIPADAVMQMMLGHMRTQLAMFFGPLDHALSAGAKRAVEQGREQVLSADWKAVLGPERVKENAIDIATLSNKNE